MDNLSRMETNTQECQEGNLTESQLVLDKILQALEAGENSLSVIHPSSELKKELIAKLIDLIEGKILIVLRERALIGEYRERIHSILGVDDFDDLNVFLTNNLKEYKKILDEFDLVVFTEAERFLSKIQKSMIEKIQKTLIGFALTEKGTRGDLVSSVYEKRVHETSLLESLKKGNCVPAEYYFYLINPAANEDLTSIGDKIENRPLKKIKMEGAIFAKYEELILSEGGTFPTLINVPTSDLAQAVIDLFRDKGISIEMISGRDSQKEIERKVEAYKNGELEVLISPNMLIEAPNTRGVINVATDESASLTCRKFASAFEKYPDKSSAKIIEIRNCHRSNLPVALGAGENEFSQLNITMPKAIEDEKFEALVQLRLFDFFPKGINPVNKIKPNYLEPSFDPPAIEIHYPNSNGFFYKEDIPYGSLASWARYFGIEFSEMEKRLSIVDKSNSMKDFRVLLNEEETRVFSESEIRSFCESLINPKLPKNCESEASEKGSENLDKTGIIKYLNDSFVSLEYFCENYGLEEDIVSYIIDFNEIKFFNFVENKKVAYYSLEKLLEFCEDLLPVEKLPRAKENFFKYHRDLYGTLDYLVEILGESNREKVEAIVEELKSVTPKKRRFNVQGGKDDFYYIFTGKNSILNKVTHSLEEEGIDFVRSEKEGIWEDEGRLFLSNNFLMKKFSIKKEELEIILSQFEIKQQKRLAINNNRILVGYDALEILNVCVKFFQKENKRRQLTIVSKILDFDRLKLFMNLKTLRSLVHLQEELERSI